MRISLFAGPGAGKSVLAAKIFAELKIRGHKIELIGEYIKQWAYEGRICKSYDQLYIFAKQLRAEDSKLSYVDHLVTDSPIIMQCAYGKRYNFDCWKHLLQIALEFEKTHPALNIFLDRKDVPYQQLGRYETYEEAMWMDDQIETFLTENKVSYIRYKAAESNTIVDFIEPLLLGNQIPETV